MAGIPVTIPPVEKDQSPEEETFTITALDEEMVVKTGGKNLKVRVKIGNTEFTSSVPKTNWLLEISADE